MKTQVEQLTAVVTLTSAPQPHPYRTVNSFRLLSTFKGHTAFPFPFVLFCALLSLLSHLATSSSIGFWLAKTGFEAVSRSRKPEGRFFELPKFEAVSYLLIRAAADSANIQVEIADTKPQEGAKIVMANSCCQSVAAAADIVVVVHFEATADKLEVEAPSLTA